MNENNDLTEYNAIKSREEKLEDRIIKVVLGFFITWGVFINFFLNWLIAFKAETNEHDIIIVFTSISFLFALLLIFYSFVSLGKVWDMQLRLIQLEKVLGFNFYVNILKSSGVMKKNFNISNNSESIEMKNLLKPSWHFLYRIAKGVGTLHWVIIGSIFYLVGIILVLNYIYNI